jgi:hypothetical protein
MRPVANAFSVDIASLFRTQGCGNPGLKLGNAFGVQPVVALTGRKPSL